MRAAGTPEAGGARAGLLLALAGACAVTLAAAAIVARRPDGRLTPRHEKPVPARRVEYPPGSARPPAGRPAAAHAAPNADARAGGEAAAPKRAAPRPRRTTGAVPIEDLYGEANRWRLEYVREVRISEYWIAMRWFKLLDELPNLESVTVQTAERTRGRAASVLAHALRQPLPPRVHVTLGHLSHVAGKPLRSIMLAGLILDKGSIALLSKCSTLRRLWLGDCELADDSVAPLAALGDLEQFNLGTGCGHGALEALGGMRRLERLGLGGFTLPPEAVGVIAGLPRLEIVEVGDCLPPADIARLRAKLRGVTVVSSEDVHY